MFPKSQRVSRAEFTSLYTRAQKIHSPTCILCYVPHHGRKASVVVSKKVAKRAVARNLLRRRLYGVLQFITVDTTGVFIVITKPPAGTKSFSELQRELHDLYRRIVKST